MTSTARASSEPRPLWTLRSARVEDAEAVVALWEAADAEPTLTDEPTSVAALSAYDPEALIVAEVDGDVVGSLIVGFDGWRANLYRLAVHPRVRRHGLGLALVAEAEARLTKRGARRANALVVADHLHAVRFWEAAGYGRDPRMGRYVKDLEEGDA
ncbi:MAG TPA: GNAT family N-acetyltransferase [Acidimicrobiales bacterium]|nr:GNAT family N-acetyltransferase [Acidimicrobiales bacterium]